jgi:hypothetical protein
VLKLERTPILYLVISKETFVVQKNGKDKAVGDFEEFQALKEEKNSSRIVQCDDIIDGQSKITKNYLLKMRFYSNG